MNEQGISETKTLAYRACSVVLACTLAAPANVAFASPAPSSSASESDSQAAALDIIDIAAQWSQGPLVIDRAGRYVLSADVETAYPLVVSAPEDAQVTIDFQGHTATVRGPVDAGIVLDETRGNVRIVDSTWTVRAAADPAARPSAGIRVLSTGGEGALAALRWNAIDAEAARTASVSAEGIAVQAIVAGADSSGQPRDSYAVYLGCAGKTADVKLSASLETCALDACVGLDAAANLEDAQWVGAPDVLVPLGSETAGCAYAVYAANAGASFDGWHRSRTEAQAGAYDWFAPCADAFALGSRFQPEGDLTVRQSPESAGAPFAHAADEASAANLAARFLGADESGAPARAEGASLAFAPAENDAEAAGSEDGEGEAADGEAALDAAKAEEGENAPAEGQAQAAEAADNQIAALSLGETADLNALWADTSKTLAITQSGTYRLTRDLRATGDGRIVINGDQIDVTIQLDGHKLDMDLDNGFTSGILVQNAASVSIEGGNGAIAYSNSTMEAAVAMSSPGTLSLKNASVSMRPSDAYTELANITLQAVLVEKGQAAIEGCDLSVDVSNQTKTSYSAATARPCGVRVENGSEVGGATIRNTSIRVVSSNMGTLLEPSELTGAGIPAYGVEALCANRVTIDGCTISAEAPFASAYAVSGKNIAFEGGASSLSASASHIAAGVESTAEGGVLLDAPLKASFPGSAEPRYRAALYAQKERCFVVGGGFSAQGLGVLVGDSADAMNEAGVCFATRNASGAATGAGAFTNALGGKAACTVTANGQGFSFQLIEERALAEVVAANGTVTRYSSPDAALAHATQRSTVRLLADAGHVTFDAPGRISTRITLDLNGHRISSLTDSSKATLQVVSSAPGGAISGSGADHAAVSLSDSGMLSIEGIAVSNESAAESAVGISVTGNGTLNLTDVDLSASSTAGETVGLSVSSNAKAAVNVTGGQLRASTTQYGFGVEGIRNLSAKTKVELKGCPVLVEGTNGSTGAVRTSGSFSATGTAESPQVLSVFTQGAAPFAWGVRSSASSAKVDLNSCSISVDAPSGADADQGSYWCLLAGTTADPLASAWHLDGSISLSSVNGTDILHGAPLTLGSRFENASGAAFAMQGSGLSDDVFARMEGASDASGAVSAFTPLAGSSYTGWRPAAEEGGLLRWDRGIVVENAQTGQGFRSLSAALAASEKGSTLQLTADFSSYEPLEVGKSVVLDLNGHRMTIDVSGADAAEAVRVKNDALLSVADAKKSGRLDLKVGDPFETGAADTINEYAGISHEGKGLLRIDGAQVNVDYVGSSEVAREVVVYGLRLKAGSASLKSGARLTVSSCEGSPSFGASSAYGIYLDEKAEGSLEVDSSSSVTVNNDSPAQQGGEVPNALVDSSTMTKNPVLERIYPEEGSELHNEIVEKFRAKARFDSAEESSDDSEHNARIYYAASGFSLDDGTYLWAFSDYVAPDEETLDNIVPSVIFMQSYYTIEPQAVGIGAAENAKCGANVNGSVSAKAGNGEARAIDAAGTGAWRAEGAHLTARAGSQRFLRHVTEPLDLRDYIENKKAPKDTWFYPKDQEATTVEEALPAAYGVRTGKDCSVTTNAATKIDARGGISIKQGSVEDASAEDGKDAAGASASRSATRSSAAAGQRSPASLAGSGFYPVYSPLSQSVEVQFTNLRTAAGDMKSPVASKVAYGETLADANAPAQGDFVQNGVTYRFIGWHDASAGAASWDPDDLGSVTVDAGLSGVSSGTVTLTAQYVRVDEGRHLITFKTDGSVVAYAALDGETPSYAAATGYKGTVPSKVDAEDSLSYSFTGWSAGRSAGDEGASADYAAGTALPEASSDKTYIACFSTSPKSAYVRFMYWKPSEGSYVYSRSDAIRVNYGSDPIVEADKLASKGSSVSADGVTYTLLGWSPRRTDKEPLYTDALPAATSSRSSSGGMLYAIYHEEVQKVTVVFHSGDEVVATAQDVPANQTVGTAFTQTKAEQPEAPSEDEAFKGWATTPDATSANALSSTSLLKMKGEDDTINLYAVFGAAKASPNANGGGAGGTTGGNGGGTLPKPNQPSAANPAGGALPSAGGGSLPSAKAAGAAPSAKSPAIAGDPAAGEGADAEQASPLAESAGEVPRTINDQVDTSFAEAGAVSGNPTIWASVIAALGAVAAMAWWMLVGRRRKADEDDDEAGWSDDKPAASGAAPAAPGAGTPSAEGGIKF